MPYVREFGLLTIGLPVNFDSKSISNAANSILNNVRDKKLKRIFYKCKVKHALNPTCSLC